LTGLVEEAPMAYPLESRQTTPLSRRVACMAAWVVKILVLALACKAKTSSTCSVAAADTVASVFLSVMVS
jgi:hypothetical protein